MASVKRNVAIIDGGGVEILEKIAQCVDERWDKRSRTAESCFVAYLTIFGDEWRIFVIYFKKSCLEKHRSL